LNLKYHLSLEAWKKMRPPSKAMMESIIAFEGGRW
jgi:hypothetical protein